MNHHQWVELQLNIGRKRARREHKQCTPIEAGPAYVHYRVKHVDIIFVDHSDGTGIGRLTGADYFHPEVPHHLYGELEKDAEIQMHVIRAHIRAVKQRRKASRSQLDPQQLTFLF